MNLFSDPILNAVMFFVMSSLAGLILGPIVIPRLKQLKFGQAIREEGPQSHLQKTGTPTMGGLIFIVAFLIPVAFSLTFDMPKVAFVATAVLSFGAVGFLDDYLKVVKKHNLGLRAKHKFILQGILSIVFALWSLNWGTESHIPFIAGVVDLGWFYVPLLIVMFLAIDNAVNLTDGLDGLASSITAIVSLFFLMMGFVQKDTVVITLSAGMLGGLIAYLKFNWYPAKVFMGDTGSLALGGYVGAMAVLLKMPLFIPLFGLIYFIETLSVMIQVGVYKKTKKRVFKMAPIHHHFEMIGWNEVTIVSRFSILTILMCLLSYVVYVH
ncbi:phospho-N-acetylmuramoyl-pentapeptide-transferase [Fusibacter bizertensis]